MIQGGLLATPTAARSFIDIVSDLKQNHFQIQSGMNYDEVVPLLERIESKEKRFPHSPPHPRAPSSALRSDLPPL
jgi:hypothetical protein